VTARGGSVGLPGKNVRPLGGVPLVGWTIRSALASGVFARVIVSTDDDEVAAIASEFGGEVPFKRPAELASSVASSADVVRHAIEAAGIAGGFALLQPTSPFRNAAHLREAVELYERERPPGVASVTSAKPLEWLRNIDDSGRLSALEGPHRDVTRRQDASPLVVPNGALYLIDVATFQGTGSLMPDGALAFCMGAIESIDIDGPDDFRLAEAIVAAGLCRIDP